MDVREVSTKILLGFLFVGLITPTLFFMRPQKAEALVSLAQCFAAKATEAGIAAGGAAVGAALSVSVADGY